MGVASGCGEQEVGVASGSGWNLWVWLLGVVLRRYIDFLILLILLLLYLYFFAAASLLFCSFFYICMINHIYSTLFKTEKRIRYKKQRNRAKKGITKKHKQNNKDM